MNSFCSFLRGHGQQFRPRRDVLVLHAVSMRSANPQISLLEEIFNDAADGKRRSSIVGIAEIILGFVTLGRCNSFRP